jgi:hypothetical protein
MRIAANATALPVHKGPAVTSAQTNLICFSNHKIYIQNRLPKSVYLGILPIMMLPNLIFLWTCSQNCDTLYPVKGELK